MMFSKRRFQFNLRTLLILVAVIATTLWGWRWYATRQMRELYQAVQESNLDSEDKRLVSSLAYNDLAWSSGLISDIARSIALKRIAWNSEFKDEHGRTARVFILDSYVREVADWPWPPTCIVTDERYHLLAWSRIADYSAGFLYADLLEDKFGAVLTVATAANWFHGKGLYRFHLSSKDIKAVGKPDFVPFSDDDPDPNTLQLGIDETELDEVLRQYR